ncbi:MAG TPA: RidA family protein [Beutenbergiaceae bacterium]|nr:RidA family protein [Beutenbergiaceae bacterium]
MSISTRLSELGLTLPDVVPPVAAYVPAVRHGETVMTSGQLPMVDGALPLTGKVGAAVSAEQAEEMAGVCALNAIAAAATLMGDVDKLTGVIKVVGFVSSDPAFTAQPGVINGASNLLQEVFGEAGVHARSAVGVAALPLDAPVEVEVIFAVTG